jgi:hypothetical protein
MPAAPAKPAASAAIRVATVPCSHCAATGVEPGRFELRRYAPMGWGAYRVVGAGSEAAMRACADPADDLDVRPSWCVSCHGAKSMPSPEGIFLAWKAGARSDEIAAAINLPVSDVVKIIFRCAGIPDDCS